MKTTSRTYSSTTSADEAIEAIAALRGTVPDLAADVTLFLALALVWGAVFYILLSSSL